MTLIFVFCSGVVCYYFIFGKAVFMSIASLYFHNKVNDRIRNIGTEDLKCNSSPILILPRRINTPDRLRDLF